MAAFDRDLVRIAHAGRIPQGSEFRARIPDEESAKAFTLYPRIQVQGYAWGMSIDLNSCTGCGACVVACQAENNIPVVGKEQVMKGREMQWIRVDTYFRGDIGQSGNVLRAGAVHAVRKRAVRSGLPGGRDGAQPRGLNEMVYNRCVGTRYCSNNCPYKVRRFNFKLYSDWTTPSLLWPAQSERDGAQPRRDGEVHVLRAADQRGEDQVGGTESRSARRRNRDGVPGGVPVARRSFSETSTIRTAGSPS